MKTTLVLNEVNKDDIQEYHGEKYFSTGAAEEVAPLAFHNLEGCKIDKLFIASQVKQLHPSALYGLNVKTILFGKHVKQANWTLNACDNYACTSTILNGGLSNEGSPFSGCIVKEVVVPSADDKPEVLRSLADAGICNAYGDVRIYTQKEYEKLLDKKLEKTPQK